MKQTAVDWLVEQFNTTINYTLEEYQLKIEQAKEMEKEQLMKAFKVGFSNGFASDILSTEKLQKEKERLFYEWFERYYNETFKSE